MNLHNLLRPGSRLFSFLLAACLLSGCGRTDSSSPPPVLSLVYTSQEDQFASWPRYLASGTTGGTVALATPPGQPAMIRLTATAGAKTGANKLLKLRRGRVEFEYSVVTASDGIDNFAVFAIPMFDSGPTRSGLVEVGSAAPDPRTGVPATRRRFTVPAAHRADHQWHGGSLDFDFTEIKSASQVVIGLRINEGVTSTGAGEILFRNVRISGQ